MTNCPSDVIFFSVPFQLTIVAIIVFALIAIALNVPSVIDVLDELSCTDQPIVTYIPRLNEKLCIKRLPAAHSRPEDFLPPLQPFTLSVSAVIKLK